MGRHRHFPYLPDSLVAIRVTSGTGKCCLVEKSSTNHYLQHGSYMDATALYTVLTANTMYVKGRLGLAMHSAKSYFLRICFQFLYKVAFLSILPFPFESRDMAEQRVSHRHNIKKIFNPLNRICRSEVNSYVVSVC